MPIKDLPQRMPRLGKIHLGRKVATADGKTTYPKALAHFVSDSPDFNAIYPSITCPACGGSGKVQGRFCQPCQGYGETGPRELDILFPIEDESLFAAQHYESWARGRGLMCKGDGDRASRMVDAEVLASTGETAIATRDARKTVKVEVVCPGRECDYYRSQACKQMMHLQFFLQNVPGLGIWQIDTGSYYSMVNINSTVALIRQMVGRIAMIPLKLRVVLKEVSPEGRVKKVPTITLATPLRLMELRTVNLLPPPDDEEPELINPTPEERAAARQAEMGANDPVEGREAMLAQMAEAGIEPTPSPVRPFDIRKATEPQLRAIYSIAHAALGKDQAWVEQESVQTYGVAPSDLTKEQASDFIDRLKAAGRRSPDQPAAPQPGEPGEPEQAVQKPEGEDLDQVFGPSPATAQDSPDTAGQGKKAGGSARTSGQRAGTGPATAKAPARYDYKQFWPDAKELGYLRDDVLKALDIESPLAIADMGYDVAIQRLRTMRDQELAGQFTPRHDLDPEDLPF